jgi:hypothetical protein
VKRLLGIALFFFPHLAFAGVCSDITGSGSELNAKQTAQYLFQATGMTLVWNTSDGSFELRDGAVKQVWIDNPTSHIEMPDGVHFNTVTDHNYSLTSVEVDLQHGNFMDLNCDRHWIPQNSGDGWTVGVPCINKSNCWQERTTIKDPKGCPICYQWAGNYDGEAYYERTNGPQLVVKGTEEQANNINRAFMHLFHLLQTAYVASKPQDPFGKQ